jgi:hypothetical protein
MSFSDDLARFAAKASARQRAIHVATAVEVKRSWVEGSPLTGAPALPIATSNAPTVGKLRRGVLLTYPEPDVAFIYTTVSYAEEVENNPRGVHFDQGGPHGHKLTVAGFPRIAEDVTKRIVGATP